MEPLNYSDEHRIFRQSLRSFLEKEIVPHIEQWEQEGIVPREYWKKMGDYGFLCTWVPEEYGGAGADFRYSVIVCEEMARCNFSGLAASLHSDIIVPYIFSFGTERQKQVHLPRCVSGDCITAVAMTEPDTGSDLAAIRTTAVERDGEIVVNGRKTFISNGVNCDLVVLAARDPSVQDAHKAIDLFLVEAGTPGFDKGRRLEKIGWHSQDTAELFFSDCRIPSENRLGPKGSGFVNLMVKLQQERLICALGAQAAAEFMLETTIAYCRERTVFGKPVTAFQNSRFEIAEMATDIRMGRTFLDTLIVDHMEGKNITLEVSMAKFWITDMAFRVADRCVQLHGGYGYCEEYPIARAWRDIRVTRIFAGTNEIMKEIVARFMGI